MALVLLGLLAVGTRYRARQQTHKALAESIWRLTYKISFEADPPVNEQEVTATVQLGRPYATPSVDIVREYISESEPYLSVEEWESKITGNREYRLTTRHPIKFNASAEFDLRLHDGNSWGGRSGLESLSSVREARYTRGEKDFPTQSPRIRQVLQRARTELQQESDEEATDSETLQWFFNYCLHDLKRPTAEAQRNRATESNDNQPIADGEGGGDDPKVEWALTVKEASSFGRAKIFVTLCRAINIPARLVAGFELRENNNHKPHIWAEVHRENRWIPFDPVNGYAREMPNWFVPVHRGFVPSNREGDSVVRTKYVKNLQTNYSILRLPPKQEVLQAEARHLVHVFDLTRLPLQLHDTLSLMLLLPLGALITAVFRNLVGLRTFGTFAPALLAMSFIYAVWSTSLVILTVVVITGLVGRTMLERLHLLMVPRLSIVLTIIILCVVFAVSLLNYWSPGQTAQSVLIPLVILTILIERFYVTSEEDSTGFAVQLVLGTVVVAAFCYLLLRWNDIGQMMLVYPEIHFFTIAAFVLIGRYSGYRLTELWRFRDLVKEETEKPSA